MKPSSLLINIFILIISANLFSGNTFSVENTKTNYSVFDSLSRQFASEIIENHFKGKFSSVNYLITQIPASRLIEREFVNLCIENDIDVKNDTANSITHQINIDFFETKYLYYTGSPDSLKRTITLQAHIKSNKDLNENFKTYNYEYYDLISRSQISALESISANYVNSNVPERKKSFYERALEPAILVSAAILSILILFTVRSN